MTQLELRQIDVELTGQKQESGELLVSGYVNQTGQWSQPLGREKRFVEKIEPGTFKRAIDKGNDIHFLAEHDNKLLLASTKNDSLVLREDDKGLFMEARISPTSWGKDYHQLISDGLLTNMSFGMGVTADKWEKRNDGTYERSISDLTLAEVSVVHNPAYVQSSIQARSLEIAPEDVSFLMQKNNNFMEDNKMSKEKTLKELRAQMEAMEAEVRAEQSNAEIRTVEVTEKVDPMEMETRAVEQFIRKQDGEELRTLTAFNTTLGQNAGSLTVPTNLSNYIVEKLYEVAPLFSRTKNFTPVNGYLEILREQDISETSVSFVAELVDAPKGDFSMDKVKLDQKRVATAIELSEQLINDSGIDIVNYAVNILARRTALKLDRNILTGAVATEFEGLLNAASITAPVTAATVNGVTIDNFLDLYNAMHPDYIGGAIWVVSRNTFNAISKLKDDTGKYFMIPDVTASGPVYRIFGQPVVINDAMPNMAANAKSVLFANLGEGYATMTKKGLTLKHVAGDTTQALRGSQLLMLDGYMDGKVLNPNAIKFMKHPAS